jgi:hypothetical protein
MSPRPLTAIAILVLSIRVLGAESSHTSPKFKDGRTELAAQITRTVEEGGKTMAEANDLAQQLDEAARAEFESLTLTARAAEIRLRRSLHLAQNASVTEWPAARAELETYYEAYSQAIAAIERFTIQASWSQ